MKIKLTHDERYLDLEAETEAEIAAMRSVGAILTKRQVANSAGGPNYFALQIQLPPGPLRSGAFERGFTVRGGG